MPYFHLTARSHRRPFTERDACVEIWARLRARMGPVLACVLMPNHLHLVLEGPDPGAARAQLSIELVAFSRRRGLRLWDPLGPPELLPDRLHLKRHIRYVHLNPCRAGLARDPLEWEWSTHRDAVGAVAAPWVDLSRVWKGSVEEFHAYVSGDPSVRVSGTALPGVIRGNAIAATLNRVGQAALQVSRSGELERVRRLALLSAHGLGGRNQAALGEWLGISPRSIRNYLAQLPSEAELRAVRKVYWVLAHPDRFFLKAAI